MALISVKIERPHRTTSQRDSVAEATGDVGRRRRGGRRLLAAAVAVTAAVGGLLLSSSPSQATIIPIGPKVIANNVSVAAHGVVQRVAIGGTTTVPTNATRVVFALKITGATSNGNVAANATGGPSSGATIHYTAGTTSTGNLTELIGANNQVAFHNGGAGSINLTVKITGYTTEVRAGDISPIGGSAGQVLTNTGTGAAWQSVGHAYGVDSPFAVQALNTGLATVASVTVPAGSYVVNFSTTIAGSGSSTPDNVGCYLFSPSGTELNAAYGNTYATDDQSVITEQGLVSNTSGGTVTAQCVDSDSSASVFYPTLIASSVGAVNGFSGNTHHGLQHTQHGPSPAGK